MKQFKDIEALEAWLAPMDYAAFWQAVMPYGVCAETRAHCDDQIARGANPDTVLEVMKWMASLELAKALKLSRRVSAPWLKLVVDNDH